MTIHKYTSTMQYCMVVIMSVHVLRQIILTDIDMSQAVSIFLQRELPVELSLKLFPSSSTQSHMNNNIYTAVRSYSDEYQLNLQKRIQIIKYE